MPVIPDAERSKIIGSYDLHVTADGEEVRYPPTGLPFVKITIEQTLGVRTELLWTRIDTAPWHAMRRLAPERGWSVSHRDRDCELWVRRPAHTSR